MRIRTQKTKTQATLPLSDEALSYCGEQGRGMVFKSAYTRTIQGIAKGCRNQEENHLPQSPPHIRYSVD